jgi:hypothetical protein
MQGACVFLLHVVFMLGKCILHKAGSIGTVAASKFDSRQAAMAMANRNETSNSIAPGQASVPWDRSLTPRTTLGNPSIPQKDSSSPAPEPSFSVSLRACPLWSTPGSKTKSWFTKRR